MECIICNHPSKYYFHKNFQCYNLTRVDYHKCDYCGFVHSETHRLMNKATWLELNHAYHKGYQGSEVNGDDPRWLERIQTQADVIKDLVNLGLLDQQKDWLDYACGDGKLFDLLDSSNKLYKYDEYMHQDNYLNKEQLQRGRFGFVITTSVFEHLLERKHFDTINALVGHDGVMGLHTMVCEQVPRDPAWFYLIPVHCAFHTNKSMSILLEQWGYVESVYNVESRLWLLFKPNHLNIAKTIDDANRRTNAPLYIYKSGFVDYWK